jgi:hypothetical protein
MIGLVFTQFEQRKKDSIGKLLKVGVIYPTLPYKKT